jgi:hypothetical protein
MIAISYRREDSSPAAGRLYDRLQAEFGKGNVFMDFDSIPYGVDFREKIRQTLEGAQLVVAVVGPNWMGPRGRGKRRINDPTDFVRLEIAQALLLEIPVIPVLLDNTAMPKVEVLPEDLRGLAYRNALTLDTGVDFHHHASRLIAGIRALVAMPPSVPEAIAHSAFISKETIAAPMPAIPDTRATPDRQGIKWVIAGALFVLALVTLVAVWSVVTAIERAISDTRRDQSAPLSQPSVRPQATEPASSVVTTFKAEAASPAPTTSQSPSPSPEPTATATATAMAVATPPPSSGFVVTSTPFPSPAWTPSPELISEQECDVLVHAFYRAVERKDMETLLAFFDEKVDYHTDGEQGKAAVKDDFTRYFKRWPVASFSIGDVRIKHAPSPETVIIVFDIRYSVQDPPSKRHTMGRADEVWVLQRINGTPRIISQREDVHPDSVPPRHTKRR